MSEEKKPDRMVSRADAMAFAEAVCRASGWPLDDEQEDLRRASEAWDAQEAAPDYEAYKYIEIKFYLTVAEAQEWVAKEHPPWWVSHTVEQHLRKARTQP